MIRGNTQCHVDQKNHHITCWLTRRICGVEQTPLSTLWCHAGDSKLFGPHDGIIANRNNCIAHTDGPTSWSEYVVYNENLLKVRFDCIFAKFTQKATQHKFLTWLGRDELLYLQVFPSILHKSILVEASQENLLVSSLCNL